MSVMTARMIRKVTAVAAAAALALSLGGCGAGNAAALEALEKQIAQLPGVTEASSTYTPGNIEVRAHSSVSVQVNADITAEQLARVTDTWAKGADSDLRIAVQSADSGSGDKTLSLDRLAATDPSLSVVLPVWVALIGRYERASADFSGSRWSLRVDTPAMTSPREAAVTVEELSALVGPGLEDASWTVRPLSAATPGLENEGVEIASSEGLPNAETRAFLASLDGAFLAARSEAGVLLEFTDRSSADPAADLGYSLDVTLWPPDMRDVPSNQINDMLRGTPTWNSTVRFVDALVPTDRFTASFSTYSNKPFAIIFSDDCARSNDATSSQFGAELWSYWLADGATTADGSSASACS